MATTKKKPAPAAAPDDTADASPNPDTSVPELEPVDRLAALEKAIGSTLGLDIRQFDPPDVIAARQKIIDDAGKAADDLVIAAEAEAASLELTDDQRLDRIERAARSAGLTL